MKFSQVAIGLRTYISSATTGWMVLQGEVKEPGDEVDAVAALPPDCTGMAQVVVSYDIVDRTFNSCRLKALPVARELKSYPSGLYILTGLETASLTQQPGDILLVCQSGASGNAASSAINLTRNCCITNSGWLCALKPVESPVTIQASGGSLTMERQ